jgi:hypothetical protein
MKHSSLYLAAASTVTFALISTAASAAELIQNGGFEDGTYTSTIDGNTNTGVPVDWTPNAAFDLEPGFNHVSDFNPHSGGFDLSISNDDNQPLAELSQSFSDVSGNTYSVSFWTFDGGANGDSNAFLTVSVGLASVTFNDTFAFPYTEGTFTFVGTGHDTLTIAARTNPSEWFVDDVSVTGAGAVPEATSWAMIALGFAGLAFASLRRGRVRAAPAL